MTKDELIEQTRNGRFKKGVSGNPGGFRKVERELILLARESVPDAFRVAREIMLNESEKAHDRLDGAKFLTAYGLGAPPRLNVEERPSEAPPDALGQLSVDDLRSLARQSLQEEAATNDADDDSDETEH